MSAIVEITNYDLYSGTRRGMENFRKFACEIQIVRSSKDATRLSYLATNASRTDCMLWDLIDALDLLLMAKKVLTKYLGHRLHKQASKEYKQIFQNLAKELEDDSRLMSTKMGDAYPHESRHLDPNYYYGFILSEFADKDLLGYLPEAPEDIRDKAVDNTLDIWLNDDLDEAYGDKDLNAIQLASWLIKKYAYALEYEEG